MTVFREDSVHGFLHKPEGTGERGLVLTHGAGGNSTAPLLVKLADAFCGAGYWVLRCDMAFRHRKPFGPPSPATAAADRESLRKAVAAMRKIVSGTGDRKKVILGGQSYGGRQSTMLAAEDPTLVEALLLLLSYPLHAPGKPGQPRTAHFPALRTPALFVHGTKDPFGTIEEVSEALPLIPAMTDLIVIEGAGHDLKRGKFDLADTIIARVTALADDPTP